MKKLPKYQINIDDEYSDGENLGLNKTAFTNRPAIVIKGMAFETQESIAQLSFKDPIKYRIAAPAMIPATIYRNQDGEEFYVEFTEKEIERIHQKFMKNFSKNKGLFNLEHTTEEVPAYMLECWLVENPEKDKSFSSYGIKVPKGSMFMVAQVTDKEYYNKLVENDQIGFSVEGFWGLSLSEHESEDINNITKIKEEKMENELMLPDGEHTINDKIYVVRDGKLVEVKDIEKVEMSEETIVEEVKLAEEVIVEAPVAEEAVVVEAEYYSKAEVDAKFDEIYQMIAKLNEEEAIEEEEVVAEMPKEKSLASGFAMFKKMNK